MAVRPDGVGSRPHQVFKHCVGDRNEFHFRFDCDGIGGRSGNGVRGAICRLSFAPRHRQEQRSNDGHDRQAQDAKLRRLRHRALEQAFDPLRQGAFGFHDPDEAQRKHRALERESGDFEQRGRIGLGLLAHVDHHHLVHGLFAHAADACVGEPEQRMPPVENLQQRLRVVRQDITAFDVRQFVEQHRAQLERGQLVREFVWNENQRSPQAANRRAAGVRGKSEADGLADCHLLTTGIEQLIG